MKSRRMKKQDIPVVAGIILEAFMRNKLDFVSFSNVFDGSFEADMDAAIKAVIDRRRPSDVLDKQKMTTIAVYEKLDEIREILRMVGEYVIMAEANLVTKYEFYRIKEAREALQNGNAEEVIEHCEVVIDKISNDDAVALDAVGLDSAVLSNFEAAVLALRELNREQVHKMNERQEVTAIEASLFAALEEFVRKVSSIGKAMYTYKEKQRYDDFSVNHILSQINHGRKKSPEENDGGSETAPVYDVMIGRITDKMTDEPLEDVVVRLEGTEIMVDTDEEGEFYLDEIPSGVYTVSFSKRGYVVGTQHNVEVGTSEMVDLSVELLSEEGTVD
jgi:Carboxypeptidase regulatory-like domain